MPYNFVADSFHTKKLCSRLSSSEVHFTWIRPFCVFARSVLPISVNWTFLLGLTAESLQANIGRKSDGRIDGQTSTFLFVRAGIPLTQNVLDNTRGVHKVRTLTQLTTRYAHHILSLFNIETCNWNALGPAFLQSCDPVLLLLLLLLLLHDLYSANFEDRVRGAGVARWRTWLTGEGEKVRF